MSAAVKYQSNKASEVEIAEHLSRCDADFVPLLSSRVEIKNYAKKIINKATRFEAWSGDTLLGLVAAYYNDQEKRIAYITSISVLKPPALTTGPSSQTASELMPIDTVSRMPATRERMRSST